MDIFAFWVVMAAITGIVFLLYPVTRRIGRRPEPRTVEADGDAAQQLADRIVPLLEQLNARVGALEQGQGDLQEQQRFLESLLEEKEPPALEPGGSEE